MECRQDNFFSPLPKGAAHTQDPGLEAPAPCDLSPLEAEELECCHDRHHHSNDEARLNESTPAHKPALKAKVVCTAAAAQQIDTLLSKSNTAEEICHSMRADQSYQHVSEGFLTAEPVQLNKL